jgi:multicomponent Na+:H+ antiporter subunit D
VSAADGLSVAILLGPALAVLTFLLRRLQPAWLVLPGIVVQLAVAANLWLQVRANGMVTQAIAGWGAPLGIGLRADRLAALLVLVTAIVAGGSALWSLVQREGAPSQRMYWPLFWFLWSALNAIWLSADLFNLYVGLELLGLSAVGLVALDGKRLALAAALRYLLAALLGSLGYLLGVALLYGSYGTLDMSLLAAASTGTPATHVALALMTAGLCIKTALFPLHGWLPPAHGVADAPVSAMLSALVVKASFYLLVRLWLETFPLLLTPGLANLLGVLGTAAVFWGGWQAYREPALKMLVAHSTVAQLGYLFLVFPLSAGVPPAARMLAMQGMTMQLVAHAAAKAAMFLAAGALVHGTQRHEVRALAGVHRHFAIALFAFGLAGTSLMGLPPSGGFVAKWLLMQSAIASGQWHWAAVLIGGGLVTAAYVFRVFRASFFSREDHPISPVPAVQEYVPFALAAIAILLGLGVAGELP